MSLSGIGNSTTDMYAAKTAAETEKNTATAVAKADTSAASKTDAPKAGTAKTDAPKQDGQAAVYDKTKLSAEDRKSIVAQLKADQEKRQSQLTELVQSMLNTQTNMFGQANNDSMWQFLAKGDYKVDAETQKKAQEAISEDGYWGVKQTSDRIVEFATSLAGDDPKLLEKMRGAFEKGYKQAEKTWGGKLPEISKKTYDAVMEKFDNIAKRQEADRKAAATDKAADTAANKSNTVTTTEDGTVIAKM